MVQLELSQLVLSGGVSRPDVQALFQGLARHDEVIGIACQRSECGKANRGDEAGRWVLACRRDPWLCLIKVQCEWFGTGPCKSDSVLNAASRRLSVTVLIKLMCNPKGSGRLTRRIWVNILICTAPLHVWAIVSVRAGLVRSLVCAVNSFIHLKA